MNERRNATVIKFRAWDKQEKTLLYNPNAGLVYGEPVNSAFQDEDYVFMQFTGLKDKNGKEIYEGDIVRILYTDWPSKSGDDPRTLDEYLRDLAHVGSVVFNPYYGWRIENVGGVNHGEHGFIEVIGNVYEHGHLLENENKE